MINLLFKRLLPSLVGLVILVLAGMWLYGFLGIKCGWIKAGDLNGMNAITRSGVDAAGGVTSAIGNSLESTGDSIKSAVGL